MAVNSGRVKFWKGALLSDELYFGWDYKEEQLLVVYNRVLRTKAWYWLTAVMPLLSDEQVLLSTPEKLLRLVQDHHSIQLKEG